MSNYILSCCSTADLSAEHFDSRDIKYICFHYTLDGKQYFDDLGKTMSSENFYQAMVDGAETKTSQVNVDEYETYFDSFLKEGYDILHVSLSGGISSSVNSAKIAAAEMMEKYPERRVLVVDSLAASSGYGLFMDKLADLRDGGMTIDELYAWAEDNKLRMHHWFFSTDLTFYVKGGRISKASGWFGTVLKICPLLNMDNNGKLIPRFKIRGKDRVIGEIVAKMEECADNAHDYDGKCYISMSACREDAEKVAALVEARFPKLNGRVLINNIGTTIGSHTGPGTVALFFWGKKRED
ncbi:MAG: DegV family protein [Ruminococcaceae bacterium]|nr:DegV family protein [Oscillospiraceae bacterium]